MTTGGRVGSASASASRSPPPPAAAAAAASSSSPQQAASFLRASFKVGSVHGRASYGFTERVFHHTDVPDEARKARAEVLARVKGRTPSAGLRRPDWRPETSLSRSLGRRTPLAGDSWEERHERRAATEGHARRSRERLRQRAEGELSPEAAERRAGWNASVSLPLKGVPNLAPADWRPRQPKQYVPPSRRHAMRVKEQRERKREARKERPFEKVRTLVCDTFHLDDTQFSHYPSDVMALQYSQRMHARDRDAIRDRVEQTYTAELLQEFLANDEAARDDDNLDKKKPATVAAERERAARRRMDSILHAAMGQGEAGGHRVLRRPVYSHPGKFEASRFEEGVVAWSCCQSETVESRGCQYDGSHPEV